MPGAALDDARDATAAALGCGPGEVVFTSGGTEADNLAVLGVHGRVGGTVVVDGDRASRGLEPARAASRHGSVQPDGRGVVDLDALAEALDATVALVSVMAVNNEVGTVQPLAAVVAEVRDARAAGPRPQRRRAGDRRGATSRRQLAECDLVSVSAHKFGGPKGVGALVVRGRATGAVAPLCGGGGQERSLRPGTENVAGIVAMATAAVATAAERPEAGRRTTARGATGSSTGWRRRCRGWWSRCPGR